MATDEDLHLSSSASSVRGSTSSGDEASQSATTVTNSTTSNNKLLYPRDFFKIEDGKSPDTEDEAKVFWKYRKERPPPGLVDRTPADGQKMLQEMNDIKRSLRDHITKAYETTALQEAEIIGIKFGPCQQIPRSKKDLLNAIGELAEPSDDSIRKVWCIFHEPFSREWSANEIDKWMDMNNMALEQQVQLTTSDGKVKKSYTYERGGFSAIATSAKTNASRTHMDKLWKVCNWKINHSGPKGVKSLTQQQSIEDGIQYKETMYKKVEFELMEGTNKKISAWLAQKVNVRTSLSLSFWSMISTNYTSASFCSILHQNTASTAASTSNTKIGKSEIDITSKVDYEAFSNILYMETGHVVAANFIKSALFSCFKPNQKVDLLEIDVNDDNTAANSLLTMEVDPNNAITPGMYVTTMTIVLPFQLFC